MEDRLKGILANINYWLKYAEAKNALLIPFCIGSIIGVLTFLKDNNTICDVFRLFLYNIAFFQSLALIVALFSFLPQTRIQLLLHKREPQNTDNLLFYGHIHNYEVDLYLRALYDACGIKATEPLFIEGQYASQIIQNSIIASRKFLYFRIAFWFVCFAILTPIMGLILYLIAEPKEE